MADNIGLGLHSIWVRLAGPTCMIVSFWRILYGKLVELKYSQFWNMLINTCKIIVRALGRYFLTDIHIKHKLVEMYEGGDRRHGTVCHGTVCHAVFATLMKAPRMWEM